MCTSWPCLAKPEARRSANLAAPLISGGNVSQPITMVSGFVATELEAGVKVMPSFGEMAGIVQLVNFTPSRPLVGLVHQLGMYLREKIYPDNGQHGA